MSVNKELTMKAQVVLDPTKAKQGLAQVDQAAKKTQKTLLDGVKAWEQKQRKIEQTTKSLQAYANAHGKAFSMVDKATGQRTQIAPATFGNRMFGGRGEQGVFGGMAGKLIGAGAIAGVTFSAGRQLIGGIGQNLGAAIYGGEVARGQGITDMFGLKDALSGRNRREQLEDRALAAQERRLSFGSSVFAARQTARSDLFGQRMGLFGDTDMAGRQAELGREAAQLRARATHYQRVGFAMATRDRAGFSDNQNLQLDKERKAIAEKEHALRQQLLEVEKQRLEVTKQQAKQTQAGMVSFGMRSPEERMALKGAASAFRSGVATREQRELLAGTPEGRMVLETRAGAAQLKSGEHADFLKSLGMEDPRIRQAAETEQRAGRLFGFMRPLVGEGQVAQDAAFLGGSGGSAQAAAVGDTTEALRKAATEIAKIAKTIADAEQRISIERGSSEGDGKGLGWSNKSVWQRVGHFFDPAGAAKEMQAEAARVQKNSLLQR